MDQKLDDITHCIRIIRGAIRTLLDIVDDDFRSDINLMEQNAQQLQRAGNLLRVKLELRQIERTHGQDGRLARARATGRST